MSVSPNFLFCLSGWNIPPLAICFSTKWPNNHRADLQCFQTDTP
jgi:hypothetical protein